jgi:hypothetical protein
LVWGGRTVANTRLASRINAARKGHRSPTMCTACAALFANVLTIALTK